MRGPILLALVATACCGCRATRPEASPAEPRATHPAPTGGESYAAQVSVKPTPDAPLTLDVLTLERAFELARGAHPELEAARARVVAARARTRTAGRLPNPDGVLRVESAVLEGETFESAEFLAGLSQPLPLGGRLDAAERVAQAELRRAELDLEAAELELASRVRGAFATAFYAQRAVELRSDLLAQSRDTVALGRVRLSHGDAASEEGLLSELASLEALHELERAETLSTTARGELLLALGLPDLEIGSLAGDLEAALALPSLDAVLERLGSNPLVLAADATLDAEGARVDLAHAERIPDLRLELLYRRIEAEDRNAFDLGLSLPLPLFQGARSRTDETRARQDEARAHRRSEELRLESLARVAHGRLAHARADLERLDREVLPRVERILALQERRLSAGDVGLEEVLLARSRASEAHLERLEALRAALAAWADLAPLLPRP